MPRDSLDNWLDLAAVAVQLEMVKADHHESTWQLAVVGPCLIVHHHATKMHAFCRAFIQARLSQVSGHTSR